MTVLPGLPTPAAPAMTLDEPLLALAIEAALLQPRRAGPTLDALVAAFRAMPPRPAPGPRPAE